MLSKTENYVYKMGYQYRNQMEIRILIRIGINTMPIHNTSNPSSTDRQHRTFFSDAATLSVTELILDNEKPKTPLCLSIDSR
jgi:hypothetical protein